MAYELKSVVSGVFKNLATLHNLRPLVTSRVYFEDYMNKTTWGVAKGLNYTTRNGQAATAAPRNNQAEWKHVRNQSGTATSAATTTSIGKDLSGTTYHWAWGAGGNVRSQGASTSTPDQYRHHIFVSKGQSHLDDVLDEHLLDSLKGVGQLVNIGCPASGSLVFLNKTVYERFYPSLVGVIYDDIVDGGNYWDLPVSISNLDGQHVTSGAFCNGGIQVGPTGVNNTNTGGGNMYPYAPNATTVGTSNSVNFYPENKTYIAVTKLDTYARANPNPISENQLFKHPYKFASTTARNSEVFAWQNGQMVIETTTPTLYEFTGTSLTTAASTTNSQWTEVTESKENGIISFLAYPDGYDSTNTDIVTDVQIDPTGFYSNPFLTPSGGNIIRYGDYGRIDVETIQTSNGWIIAPPTLYGTNGIYPAPTGLTVEVDTVANSGASRQAVWKTVVIQDDPANQGHIGTTDTYNGTTYSIPSVSRYGVIDNNSGCMGNGVVISGVVYLVAGS